VSEQLRVVTLNLWGTQPPLEARLALAVRQLQALAPDVVCLQEVRPLDGRTGRTTAELIADGLGMAAHYAVAVAWDDGEGALPAGQEGLAVIARSIRDTRVVPLPEPRPADARILLSAAIDTAGGPIWVHTRTCTTGSTTALPASTRCSRSTRRSARWAASATARRRSCAATSTHLRQR